jgi:SAM-dependent methyltransferase
VSGAKGGGGGFRDHFAPQAAQYAAYRPGYPAALIAALAGLAPSRDCCWDVGTGSGQAAVMLAEHFDRVIATDASERQVAHAVPHPRVTYLVAPAERAPLSDGSVSLVTVAQALHWFDRPAFYREVQRVAAPGGVIAAWSYGLLQVDADVDAQVQWFYEARIGRYWPAERRHVETGYTTLDFPFERIAVPAPALEVMLDRAAVLGLIGTWSAVAGARTAEGGDPVAELAPRLAAVWPDAGPRLVRWPLALLVGRVGEAVAPGNREPR